MAEVVEVKVPDIGDFDEVPVIEILVEAGQEVGEEDPLITLESDKATMDVPAPAAGVVDDLKVSVGDKVSEGTLILTLTPSSGNGAAPDAEAAPEPEVEPESEPAPDGGPAELRAGRPERPPEGNSWSRPSVSTRIVSHSSRKWRRASPRPTRMP